MCFPGFVILWVSRNTTQVTPIFDCAIISFNYIILKNAAELTKQKAIHYETETAMIASHDDIP
ncbi:hypothetical protein CGA24_01125 (plasmid) [Salmonella enterica subsp. enterica]|nr:hypothetical protein CGA24_01125 [Salmonella enterica subsp. enterica]